MTFATVDEARKAHQIAHDAWWAAYLEMKKHGKNELRDKGQFKESVFVCSNPRLEAQEAALKAAALEIRAAAIAQFAKPQVADCEQCKSVSVFGGPSHDTSPRCRSGRRPHCTCDTCF